jgi:hypothetical protein
VEYTPSEPMGDGSRRVGVLVGLTDLGPREAVEAVMTCVGGSGWGEVFDGPRFSSATRVTQGQLRQLEVHAGARLTVQVTGD